jgi:hypothetical protein
MTTNLQKPTFVGSGPFSHVWSVSQVLLKFQSDDPKKTFVEIRNQALRWLAKRAGRPLPKDAWDGESFDLLEVGAQPVSALALEEPYYWCFRISDADKEIARRHWTTEAGILLNDDSVLFGCRLQCVVLGESPSFIATIPGVVAQVVNHHAAYLDGRRISLKAWNVDSKSAATELIDLLLDSARTRPVIVISLGDKDGHDGHGVIDADDLARLTVGAAHVITLTGDASYALTDQLGKRFSVFHQAVRTYRPRLDIYEDTPTRHPIALPGSIEEWTDGGAAAFKLFLIERTLRDTVVGIDIYQQLPPFADIHAQVLKQKRAKASVTDTSDKELLKLALEENDQLRDNKQTYDALLQSADEDRKQIERERDEVRSNYHALQSRVTYLEEALRETGKQEDTPIPNTFEDLETWCTKYLSGRVYVIPRACRAAIRSVFRKPELAYNTLLILRDFYVPMKREGGLEMKKAYEQQLANLGLEDSKSFAGARSGEQGDQYKVTYNGRSHYLDRHIKGSNSREESFGFRLYFFWDEVYQQAVVGWFPTHLSTRAT